MSKKVRRCVICGKTLPKGEYGNNPEPIKPFSSGVCCNECNVKVVEARIAELYSSKPKCQGADRTYRPGMEGDWVISDKEPL